MDHPATVPSPSHRGHTTGTAALSAVFVCLLAAGHALSATDAGLSLGDASGSVAVLAAQAVGLLIVVRRPGNRVGRIVCALAWIVMTQTFLTAWTQHPGAARGTPALHTAALWVDGKLFLVLWGAIIALFLHFPDGRLPSPRWRWAVAAGLIAVAGGTLLFAVKPGPLLEERPVSATNPANPTAVNPELWETVAVAEPLLTALLVAALVASLVSLVVRYRRAGAVQQLQIRWVVTAAVIFGVALTGNVAVRHLWPAWLGAADAATGITFSLLPVSVGVAVLRRRLYDIDRIISRGVAWLAVTVVVVGVYLAGVALLTATVAPRAGGSPLVVAASTLAAAAAFRPARRQIQDAVDRRFNRARYDAGRTVEKFSARLRDEVDLDSLHTELIAVVCATMEPAGTALWLREADR